MRLVRRLSVALVALAVLSGAVAVAAPAAEASTASSFTSLINSARSSAGLAPYSVRSDLAAVAQGQAARMAASHKLYHNPSLATQVKGWSYVGENVGYGPDVSSLMSAFMHSAPHRANILDHQFTQVGVGAVTAGGTIWVSMVFRRPSGSSSATTTHKTTVKHTAAKPKASTSTRHAVRAPVRKPVAAPGTAPVPAATPVPDGVRCEAGPAVARQLSHVGDLERSARMLEVSQHLLLGFQCGSHLPLTGVLDPATQAALSA